MSALPRGLLIAIAQAVRDAGGDMEDVDDLVSVWQRLQADKHGRVDRLRTTAATVTCCCADGGVLTGDGRCGRCYGRVGVIELLDGGAA